MGEGYVTQSIELKGKDLCYNNKRNEGGQRIMKKYVLFSIADIDYLADDFHEGVFDSKEQAVTVLINDCYGNYFRKLDKVTADEKIKQYSEGLILEGKVEVGNNETLYLYELDLAEGQLEKDAYFIITVDSVGKQRNLITYTNEVFNTKEQALQGVMTILAPELRQLNEEDYRKRVQRITGSLKSSSSYGRNGPEGKRIYLYKIKSANKPR